MASPPGNNWQHFAWYDLMTQDVAKAQTFYTTLLGLRCEEVDLGPFTYRMLHAGARPIGGIVPLDGSDHPAHWMSYVSVEDIQATCAKVKELGGRVCVPPFDLGAERGWAAVIDDLQGAVLSLLQHAVAHQPVSQAELQPGMVCWNELWTKDPAAGSEYYGQLFGWTARAEHMGPDVGMYYLQHAGDTQLGGIVKGMGGGDAPPYWCPYFVVDDVDASITKIAALGGEVLMGGMDIPDVGRFGVAKDDQGAVFCVFKNA